MILYILKSTLCLALVYVVYKLLLEPEKMAAFNRFFLLFGLLFALVVPLLNFEYAYSENILEPLPKVILNLEATSKNEITSNNSINWMYYFYCCYGFVVLFLFVRLIYHLTHLYSLIREYPKLDFRGVKLVLLEEDSLPYTFGPYIFVSAKAYQRRKIEEELFIHELAHVRQWHSLDVLFLECLQTVFWLNPILFFYKKAVQLNHEFLADEQVIQQSTRTADYQHLLLDKISSNHSISLTSNLNFSLTKKRLQMMTKITSRSRMYSLASMTIPLFLGLFFLFSNKVEAQVSTDKGGLSKDDYFKNATVVYKKAGNKKIYKPYTDLTKKEKSTLPPPPPKPNNGKLEPLPKGSQIYVDGNNVVIGETQGNIPPPPPPPAPQAPKAPSVSPVPPVPPTPPTPPNPDAPETGYVEINGELHLYIEGAEGRTYYTKFGDRVNKDGVILEPATVPRAPKVSPAPSPPTGDATETGDVKINEKIHLSLEGAEGRTYYTELIN